MGVLRMRNTAYSAPATRDKFDEHFDFVSLSLLNARTTAREVADLWEGHASRVASGEIARLHGQSIRIDENIDKDLRKQVEGFLNVAVRVLKQGMQGLAAELHVDIGFMFKQQGAFDKGIVALHTTDPALAEYLRQARAWSERLVQCRNDVEHKG